MNQKHKEIYELYGCIDNDIISETIRRSRISEDDCIKVLREICDKTKYGDLKEICRYIIEITNKGCDAFLTKDIIIRAIEIFEKTISETPIPDLSFENEKIDHDAHTPEELTETYSNGDYTNDRLNQ